MPARDAPSAEQWRGRLAFCVILCAAAVLRLWNLETPSLWFDEALVAMVARLPLDTILERALREDFHPPAFYLMAKAAMDMGTSDAALRLPQVLAGLAGVWLAWKAGRKFLDDGAGLAMAALTAVQPWHVLLSRQLRPYGIIFPCCLLGFLFLWRALRSGRARDCFLCGLALLPPVLLHFSGLLAAAGAGFTLLCACLRGRVSLKGLVWFCLPCALAVAGVLPFFASLLGRAPEITHKAPFLQVLPTILEKLSELLFRENHPSPRLALAGLTAAGLWLLFARERLLAWLCVGWTLPPLAALLAARYGSYFNPWHLTFLLPPILACQAYALRMALGARLAPIGAVALATGGMAWYFLAVPGHYYEPDSHGGHSRQMAAALLGSHVPGTAYVYPESAVSGPLNWYLDRFSEPNPLRAQSLGLDGRAVAAVVPGSGRPALMIVRAPMQAMGPLPYRAHITCSPDDFLSRVHSLEYVACQPVLEHVLIATQARRAGYAQFAFANSLDGPREITVNFGYSNRKPGNRFAVWLRFDDEPWEQAFRSVGPDGRSHDKVMTRRDRPYRTLLIRFELWRDGRSFAFTGEDIEAVRLTDFKVEATQPGAQ